MTRMKDEELEAKIKTALEGTVAGLVAAFLFGSHAAGRSHRESDVDIGVLLDRTCFPSPRARFERGVEVSSRLQASLGTRLVDLVVLNDAPPGLGRRVVTSGRRLLDRDPEATHAFVRDAQLRAADLDPFLRWTREIKLAALAR
jgi:predicted nucleotidyltransferase